MRALRTERVTNGKTRATSSWFSSRGLVTAQDLTHFTHISSLLLQWASIFLPLYLKHLKTRVTRTREPLSQRIQHQTKRWAWRGKITYSLGSLASTFSPSHKWAFLLTQLNTSPFYFSHCLLGPQVQNAEHYITQFVTQYYHLALPSLLSFLNFYLIIFSLHPSSSLPLPSLPWAAPLIVPMCPWISMCPWSI